MRPGHYIGRLWLLALMVVLWAKSAAACDQRDLAEDRVFRQNQRIVGKHRVVASWSWRLAQVKTLLKEFHHGRLARARKG